MQILAFAGSLRRDSSDKKLAREAARLLERHSAISAEFTDLKDCPMPLCDGDLEQSEGIPAMAAALGRKIIGARAIVSSTPEYNGMSSVLKNTIDWTSRVKPSPFADKYLLLLSASGGGWGGVRGLWHSRVPFEALGVHVFPQMMCLPHAHTAVDVHGHLKEDSAHQLRNLLSAFAGHVVKRAALQAA
jgi:NAD(P)H-dependent FMN reductase